MHADAVKHCQFMKQLINRSIEFNDVQISYAYIHCFSHGKSFQVFIVVLTLILDFLNKIFSSQRQRNVFAMYNSIPVSQCT